VADPTNPGWPVGVRASRSQDRTPSDEVRGGIAELVRDHNRRLVRLENWRTDDLRVELEKIRLTLDRCERPLKTMSKVVVTVGTAVLISFAVALSKLWTFHVPSYVEPGRSGEVLGTERQPSRPAPPAEEPRR
jgi:hypothetical protein